MGAKNLLNFPLYIGLTLSLLCHYEAEEIPCKHTAAARVWVGRCIEDT